ncbi:YccF domain-containing protein [Actinomyces faecalis]|uniref:YccF domain-containing protein n=1 Tax=Actinomyces faecalis TaxID=2722820 RepID=UPI001553761E|nr:YccF domain-containing protein [Actinomyces faecalis]
MRALLNIIWVVFGGFWLFLSYLFFGVVACVFIVTIPAGVACFRIAGYALWPFGRTVVERPGAGAMSGLSNLVWFLVAGLWLAIGHVTTAAAQAVTIIGIPLAIANLKMIPVTCFPFGKEVVDGDGIL